MKISNKIWLVLFSLILVFLVGGVFIPEIAVRDASGLSQEEIKCAKNETRLVLDNPLERVIILELAVSGKEGRNLYVDAYTFFGIKYAKVRVICNDSAEVLWRVWRKQVPLVNTFEECAKMGYPIGFSYPPQCWTPDGRHFVETITPAAEPSGGVCVNLCGDGICQEVVCMGTGCPCSETPETCPADCKPKNNTVSVSLGQQFTLKKDQVAKIVDTSLEVEITAFYNSPCPTGVQCIWSGVGIGFEYRFNGQAQNGINLVQVFGYQTTIVGTNHETYANLIVEKMK